MTDDEIQRIERERRRREALLLALLLLMGNEARRFAAANVRMGNDPIQAIRNVVLGNPRLHLPGIAGPLAQAMAEAHVAGMSKAFDLADEPMPDETLPIYSAALGYYRTAADETATRIYDGMNKIVVQSIADAAAAQKRTAGIAREVLRGFTRYGWTRFDPQTVNPDSTGSAGYAAVTESTNAILTAYNGGMFAGYVQPPILEKLTAFTHRSVIDERTSEWCDENSGRDGLTLPPNHPYWLSNWCPLHGRCRSLIFGRFGDVDFSEALPVIPPQPGFGQAPIIAFGYRFGRAA